MDSSVYWFGLNSPPIQPLRSSTASEVVVVGGGIAGLTCAHALAERGREVVLVEQAFCGAGASGRSSGFVTPDSELDLSDLVGRHGPATGRTLWEFARSGVERIRRTIDAFRIDCDYQVQDSLVVARSAKDLRTTIDVEHRTLASLGYPSTLYDRAGLEAIFGSRVYRGGLRTAGTFGMNAYAYCRALRDAIERQGVRIFEGTLVTRFTGGGVETPGGSIAARTVLALADRDLPHLGLAGTEIFDVQTFLSISRPLRESEIRVIFPAEPFMVWDTGLIYPYFRITGEGRLLLGGATLGSVYSRGNGRTSPDSIDGQFKQYLGEHFPSLAIDFDHIWSGRIGVSKDFAPVAGRHPDYANVYFAGAAAGLPWAAALGEYLAQKITEGRDELDALLSASRPYPVGRGVQRLLGKPAAFLLSHAIEKYFGGRPE
jgi:gamma-glutamylputrescine oxidase